MDYKINEKFDSERSDDEITSAFRLPMTVLRLGFMV